MNFCIKIKFNIIGLAGCLADIIIVINYEEAAAINVALGKRSTLCEVVYLHSKLFDGNIKVPYEVYFVLKYCKGRPAFITVSLDDPYYVHYVVVYAGITKGDFSYFR